MFDEQNLKVEETVGQGDEMFHEDRSHYFSVGKSGLWNVQRAMSWAYPEPRKIERILDFPCGHGRVMRYLKAAYPEAEITGCDLNRAGVDFCASVLGAVPVYSKFDPSDIPLPADHFDLIWVGSLFTHIDAARWNTFLTLFSKVLKPGGLLVFSSQGRLSYEWLTSDHYNYGLDQWQTKDICSQYESTGFGYVDYRGENGYGITLCEPAWTCRMITSMPGLKLVGYGEKCWDNHHDIVACIKDTQWVARTTPHGLTQPRPFKGPTVAGTIIRAREFLRAKKSA